MNQNKLLKKHKNRFMEIDFLKGFAVIFMVIFHIPYLYEMMGYGIMPIRNGTLHYLARIAEYIFITTVGVNLSLSKKKNENKKFIKLQLYRVLKLLIYAFIITASTYYIFPNMFVRFGILHFIAISVLILMWFSDSVKANIIFSFFILFLSYISLCIGNCLNKIHPLLTFILGLTRNYSTMDHFPIIPWIIYVSIGIIIGNIIYKKNNEKIERKYKFLNNLDNYKNNIFSKYIQYLGKNSFFIYTFHFVILYILIKITMNFIK